MRKTQPADKRYSTQVFLRKLVEVVETNKVKFTMRRAYVDCLKSNIPGNRFTDLETLVYLVDMMSDRLNLARLLPTLSNGKLADENNVNYVDKGGRTQRLSDVKVCSSGEGGVRPETWVLSV